MYRVTRRGMASGWLKGWFAPTSDPQPNSIRGLFNQFLEKDRQEQEDRVQILQKLEESLQDELDGVKKKLEQINQMHEQTERQEMTTLVTSMKKILPTFDEIHSLAKGQYEEAQQKAGTDKVLSEEEMEKIFDMPEVKDKMATNEALRQAHERFVDLQQELDRDRSTYTDDREQTLRSLHESIWDAFQEAYDVPQKRYSPQEMAECFDQVGILIQKHVKDPTERQQLNDIFDRPSYDMLVRHQAETETAKLNHKLQTVYQDLLHRTSTPVEATTGQTLPKENAQTEEPIDTEQLLQDIKFSANDMVQNLASMRKLPQVFRAVLSSTKIPADVRNKYDGLDVKLEKLSPTQLKNVSKVLCKYTDPQTHLISPVKLIVIVGELLTYKSKQA